MQTVLIPSSTLTWCAKGRATVSHLQVYSIEQEDSDSELHAPLVNIAATLEESLQLN